MSKRIFVVDDEPKIGNLFSNVLERDGYDVNSFVNPRSLIEALDEENEEPDVVVADMIMPEMDGVELMETLQERELDVPIIIMTAHSSVQTAVEAMRQGAFHYLEKPVNLEEMRALLEKAIELYGAQQELKQIKTEKQKKYPIDGILGESDAIVRVRETIETLASLGEEYVFLVWGDDGCGDCQALLPAFGAALEAEHGS